MQSLLVPAIAPTTPGFAVETVYIPASEVSGDFFHVFPGEDRSLLIVAGDVSGKGLKAAMTVSAIIGRIARYDQRQPADVLVRSQSRPVRTDHWIRHRTAALITRDGTMTIANAGNLAPYRNGEGLAARPACRSAWLPTAPVSKPAISSNPTTASHSYLTA